MGKKNHSEALLFVAGFPPLVTGAYIVNQQIKELLAGEIELVVINTSSGQFKRSIKNHTKRGWRTLQAIFFMFIFRAKGNRKLYYPIDGGLGQIWNISLLIFARILNLNIFLHHHNYAYINRKSKLMGILSVVAGKKATHLVLCNDMGNRLKKLYPSIRNCLFTPNVVENQHHVPQEKSNKRFCIGLLSNLFFEKGIAEFIQTHKMLLDAGLDVDAVLAGSFMNGEIEEYVNQAIAESPDRLSWIGPVYGQIKSEFYAKLDIFLFPTKYENESFGLVLMEASSHGVPFVASSRGCMGMMSGLEGAHLVPATEQFAPAAFPIIKLYYDQKMSNSEQDRTARIIEETRLLNQQWYLQRQKVVDLIAR